MEDKVCPMLIATGNPAIDTTCGKEMCAWWVPTLNGGGCCAIQLLGAAEAAKQRV